MCCRSNVGAVEVGSVAQKSVQVCNRSRETLTVHVSVVLEDDFGVGKNDRPFVLKVRNGHVCVCVLVYAGRAFQVPL